MYITIRRGPAAGDNPWDGWTLEWATTSPPDDNFVTVPPARTARPLGDLQHLWMASSGKRDPAGGKDGGNDWAIKRAWSITLELSTPMLGTLVFITSEIFFFGSLIVSFLYFRSRSVSGPGPH